MDDAKQKAQPILTVLTVKTRTWQTGKALKILNIKPRRY